LPKQKTTADSAGLPRQLLLQQVHQTCRSANGFRSVAVSNKTIKLAVIECHSALILKGKTCTSSGWRFRSAIEKFPVLDARTGANVSATWLIDSNTPPSAPTKRVRHPE
jgi:hypothetical protein